MHTPIVSVPSARTLLTWYDRHRRTLPWRAPAGQRAPAYHVWLSEIMLQQTTAKAVAPYYTKFLTRFPTLESLAAASEDEMLPYWAGLGYYARARNLLRCARMVAASGGFPETVEALRALPGIGAYTAHAIAAIAFDIPVVPVDGNVERVTARVFAVREALPAAKPRLAKLAAALGAQVEARARPGDFAQALFDLGATLCTRRPACALCPWRESCAAHAQSLAPMLPARAEKKARPLRHGVVFWATCADQVLLRKRPQEGLLGGMTELPGTPWRPSLWSEPEALTLAPLAGEWQRIGCVQHVFTHFELQLTVYAAAVTYLDSADGYLCPIAELEREALPSVMRKCVRVAVSQ